jgi:Zn-dependent peptidase ImmA (M78 family)
MEVDILRVGNGWFMEKDLILKAREKAADILGAISYNGSGMVDTKKIIDHISSKKGKISVLESNFEKIKRIKDFGAMMYYQKNEDSESFCEIYLNNKFDPIFKRFSLAHELGHLCLQDFTPGKMIVSTHINYSLTYIPSSLCDDDEFLKKEELANVFALELLMPTKHFLDVLNKTQSFKETANFFGVTVDAVNSKMFLLKEFI